MGESGDEDLSKFDPKEFWKETNHEPISGVHISKHERIKIEKLVTLLKTEKTLEELVRISTIPRNEILRLFKLFHRIKGLVLNRHQLKTVTSYTACDFRKDKHPRKISEQEKASAKILKFGLRPGFSD